MHAVTPRGRSHRGVTTPSMPACRFWMSNVLTWEAVPVSDRPGGKALSPTYSLPLVFLDIADHSLFSHLKGRVGSRSPAADVVLLSPGTASIRGRSPRVSV